MESLRKLWFVLTPGERLSWLALVGATCVTAALEALGIGLVLPFIAIVNEPESVFGYPLAGPLATRLGLEQASDIVIAAGAIMLAVVVVKSAYLAFVYRLLFRFLFDRQLSISRRLMEGYLAAPYTFYLQRNTADLTKTAVESTHRIAAGFMQSLMIIVSELLVLLAVVALLLFVAPLATLGALALLSLPLAGFYLVLRRRLAAMGRLQQEGFSSVIKWLNQAFGSIKETKLLGGQQFFLDHHRERARQIADTLSTAMFANQLPRCLIEPIVVCALVAVVVVAYAGGGDLQSALPVLGMLAVAAVRLTPSVNRIGGALADLRFNSVAADIVYRELREADERRRAEGDPTQGRAIVPLPLDEELAMQDVSYRYPESHKWSVSHATLSIPKGHRIGLVGPTGSGKTTMVDLILGLLAPTEGRILVDGQDIRGCMAAWQRNIGYVPQNVYLTDDSIRRNVAFALPDGQIDDDRVWRALRLADLDEVVRGHPDGLDALVGERGLSFSGGERQRVGIARALYRDPEILVLDEATASLDSETEANILRSVEGFAGEKTVIMIAHKLSVVAGCDRLYVLEGGRIAASGTYGEVFGGPEGRGLVEGVR